MSRIALIKLQPNQDLYDGLETACRDVGVRAGFILSGVGSVNDAWFTQAGEGSSRTCQGITGPGIEMAGINGEIIVDANGRGTSVLSGWATRQDGTVCGGVLLRERNIVCITFELTIMEWETEA